MTANKNDATRQQMRKYWRQNKNIKHAREELQDRQEKESHTQKHYTLSGLSAAVRRMETAKASNERRF